MIDYTIVRNVYGRYEVLRTRRDLARPPSTSLVNVTATKFEAEEEVRFQLDMDTDRERDRYTPELT